MNKFTTHNLWPKSNIFTYQIKWIKYDKHKVCFNSGHYSISIYSFERPLGARLVLAPRPSEGFLLALRVPGDGCDICNTHNPTSTSMKECTPYPHPSIGAQWLVNVCHSMPSLFTLWERLACTAGSRSSDSSGASVTRAAGSQSLSCDSVWCCRNVPCATVSRAGMFLNCRTNKGKSWKIEPHNIHPRLSSLYKKDQKRRILSNSTVEPSRI